MIILSTLDTIDILRVKHVFPSESLSIGMLEYTILLPLLTLLCMNSSTLYHNHLNMISKTLQDRPRPPCRALPHTSQSVQPSWSGLWSLLELTWRSRHSLVLRMMTSYLYSMTASLSFLLLTCVQRLSSTRFTILNRPIRCHWTTHQLSYAPDQNPA
jgi:hypothetical protein